MLQVPEAARAVEGEVDSRRAVPLPLHKVDHLQQHHVVRRLVPPEVNIRVWQQHLAILLGHHLACDSDTALGVRFAHAVARALLHLDDVRRVCVAREAQNEVAFTLTDFGNSFPLHGWHKEVGKYKGSTFRKD
eukprot:scaffold53653_cov70-Phaeocystis_antarctica.AAC.9